MADLILETTFLIDLDRELARGESGPAQTFLEERSDARLAITFTIAGELAAGQSLADSSRWRRFLSSFEVLPWSLEVSWHYGENYRFLARNGLLIGTNDLWIAATARAQGLPLVTRNHGHFGRVPNLEVLTY